MSEGRGDTAAKHWVGKFEEPVMYVGWCMQDVFACCARGSPSFVRVHAFQGEKEFFRGGKRSQACTEVVLEGLVGGAVNSGGGGSPSFNDLFVVFSKGGGSEGGFCCKGGGPQGPCGSK